MKKTDQRSERRRAEPPHTARAQLAHVLDEAPAALGQHRENNARQRRAQAAERRHEGTVVERDRVVAHRHGRENEDARQRHARHRHERPGDARDAPPDVDRAVRRHDARHHLEERELVEELAFLQPAALFRKDLLRDRNDRVAAAHDEERDAEHVEEQRRQFLHIARMSARFAHATASYSPSCHVRASICGTQPNISHRSPSL